MMKQIENIKESYKINCLLPVFVSLNLAFANASCLCVLPVIQHSKL